MNRFCVAVFLLILALPAFSQESDTIYQVSSDSIFRLGMGDLPVADTEVVKPRKEKYPARALMYALVFPGLGQAYNGKYWKIPIVWGALGAVGYVMVFNTRGYKGAVNDYILDSNEATEFYLDAWKRNMELSYIVGILVYGLQILDAYVDANLSTWNVNDNLSLRFSPSLQPLMAPANLKGFSGGLTCSFNIKGR